MKCLKHSKIYILSIQIAIVEGQIHITPWSRISLSYAHDYSVLSMIFIIHNNFLFLPYYSVTPMILISPIYCKALKSESYIQVKMDFLCQSSVVLKSDNSFKKLPCK